MRDFQRKPLFDFREQQGAGDLPKRKGKPLLRSTSIGALLTRPKQRPKQPRVEVEPLEPRILLSADPFFVAMGADQNDLTLTYDAAQDLIQIHDSLTGDPVAEQLRAETSSVTILGTDGDDRLVMDMAGSYIFPAGVFFDAGGGEDELVGAPLDSTWIIDGIDSGSVEGLSFDGVENLTGAAGNEDIFALQAGAQITGLIEGGDAGFDTVTVDGGGENIAVSHTGPDSGSITVGSRTTQFAGMEPIAIGAAPNFAVTLDDTAQNDVTLTYVGDVAGKDRFHLAGSGFENTDIDVATGDTLTINMGGGADQITVSEILGTKLDGNLTINLGDGADSIILGSDYGTLNISGGADGDDDTVTVTASAGGFATTVVGDVITTTPFPTLSVPVPDPVGVATLIDNGTTGNGISDFASVSGDSIVFDITQFTAVVDQVFADIADTLAALEDAVNLGASLPLVGGSTLIEQADVTIAKALDFFETIDQARAQVIAEMEARAADGLNALEITQAFNAVSDKIAEALGPALLSDAAATLAELQAAILTAQNFVFDVLIPGEAAQTITVAAGDLAASTFEGLVDAVNAAIGLNDVLSGKIGAAISNGRLAFEVLDSEVTQLQVRAGAADVLAESLFGYGASYATLLQDQIESRLKGLGDLLFGFDSASLLVINQSTFLLSFDFGAARSTGFAYEFGVSDGLSFEATAKLDMAVGFDFGTLLVIDASNIADVTFSGQVTEFKVGAEIEATGIDIGASVGVLEGNVTGSVLMNAALLGDGSVAISSGGGGIEAELGLTTGGFDYNFANDTYSFTGSADYTVELTMTVDAGLIAGSLGIEISVGEITDPFSGDTPTVNFTGGVEQDFLDFNNLTPASLVQGVADFVLWLQDAAGSQLLADIDLPFLDGGLDDIIKVAQWLSDELLYDYGGDGEKDGEDRLVTDLNDALLASGLDAFLRFEGNGSAIELVFIDDNVDSVTVLAGEELSLLGLSIGDILNTAGELLFSGSDFANASALAGVLGITNALKATLRVNFKDGREAQTGELEIEKGKDVDNRGIGDDAAKLIDRFNAPTFKSVQDFLVRLGEIGVLPGIDPNDLSSFYDTTTDQLIFDLNLGGSTLFDAELAADFDLDLGTLIDVYSDTRLVLTGGASIDLGLGFDLSSNPGPSDLPSGGGDLDGTETLAELGVVPKDRPAITGDADPTLASAPETSFTLELNGSSFAVTVPAYDLTNVLTLAAHVNQALAAVDVGASNTLADYVAASYQGARLTLTLLDQPTYSTLEVTSGSAQLGIPAATANTNDLAFYLSDSTVQYVDLASATTLNDVMNLIATELGATIITDPADVATTARAVWITFDDVTTPQNEAGSGISVKYDDGGTKLTMIRGLNGSPAATQLGLVADDVNPQKEGDVADGIVQGATIGGVTLADRVFFTTAPLSGGATTAELVNLNFEAVAGRLVDDLQLAGDDILFSSSVDLRDFVTTSGDKLQIEIKDVSGFNDGTYVIEEIAAGTISAATAEDPAATTAVEGVRVTLIGGGAADLGEQSQAGGVGVILTGVSAGASLGFVGVELTGEAEFGAELSLGLNAGTGQPAADGILSLAEVGDTVDEGGLSGLLNLFAFPELTPTVGVDTDDDGSDDALRFGFVDLQLGLETGSDGFNDIANALLGGTSSVGVSIELLAFGDPVMKQRFEQAGGFAVTDSDTFTVLGNFEELMIEGATIRFVSPTGTDSPDLVWEAKLGSVSYAAGTNTTTVDLTELTVVSGPEGAVAGLTTPASGSHLDQYSSIQIRPSAKFNATDFGALSTEGFGSFDLDTLLDALFLLADALSEMEDFQFFNETIPVIDKSLSEIFSLADDLRDFIDSFRDNPAASLQVVENALNDAIGLSGTTLSEIYEAVHGVAAPAGLKAFEIGYDAAEEMLTFTLNIGAGFSEALTVGLSDIPFAGDVFEDLALPGGLFSFSGSAGLAASGGIFLTVALGIDLDELAENVTDGDAETGIEDAFYVLDDTDLSASLSASGENLAFNAGLGPLSLSIGNNGTDTAHIAVEAGAGISTLFADRVSLGTLADSETDLTAYFDIGGNQGAGGDSFGSVHGLLPVFFPTDSRFAGNIYIGEDFQDSTNDGVHNSGYGAFENIGNFEVLTEPDDVTAKLAEPGPIDEVIIDVSELTSFIRNFDLTELSIFDNIRLAVDGFDGFLGLLEENIFGALADLELPLVGEAFGDAANFIGDFRAGFIGNLTSALDLIEDATDKFIDPDENVISVLLYDLLGPNGLDLLQRLDGLAIDGTETVGDFIALNPGALEDVLFNGAPFSEADIGWFFELGPQPEDLILPNVPLNFDIGIPGIGLETDAEITFELDWGISLGFGLSAQKGFYFDFDNYRDAGGNFSFEADGTGLGETEIEDVFINASVIPEGEITGKLGFLALTASTDEGGLSPDSGAPGLETGLEAGIQLQVTDAGGNADVIGITELGSIGLAMTIDVTAAAALDLVLGLDEDLVGGAVASGFPSVVADFEFLWTLNKTIQLIGAGPVEADNAFGLQYLAFNNVGLDLGSLLNDVLGPIVDAVSEYTEPLQPFIDFLTAPIPLVDAFGVELTMLDLAAQVGNVDARLIETLAEIITVINEIAALRDAGGVEGLIVPLGDFVIFDGAGANPFEDGVGTEEALAQAEDVAGSVVDAFLSGEGGIQSDDQKKRDASKTIQKLKKPGGAFAFPILEDPGQIFGLLMGDPATLVTFDLEPLIVGFEKSFFFSIFGPLGVSLGLQIEFTADFAFGYDTKGIQDFVETDFVNPLLIFDGLYISDTENPDGSGADVPELTFLGGITAAAELNLGIARAGVAGGLFIEILFDLFDPDGDGKVRISELISNVENQLRAPGAEVALAPLAVFDVYGSIFARLFAFLKIDFGLFELDKEWNIVPPFTILDFEIDFFRPPVVASETGAGDLIINIGEFAAQRLLGDTSDFGEEIHIRKASGPDGSGYYDVEVWTTDRGFGDDSPVTGNRFTYKVKGGESIIVRAGLGDDRIFLHDWAGDEVLFDIEGGQGNDRIEFMPSTGSATNGTFNRLIGGVGNDTIIGSGGRDFVEGGAGNDDVSGGGGDDLVLGDDAEIFTGLLQIDILGNAGRDTVSGGGGSDIVIGGGGQDSVLGGSEDDLILSDGGAIAFTTSTVLGIEVTDQMVLGNVLALHLGGVTGTDAPGEGQADTVDGGSGNDVIFASGGNDSVLGGTGNDEIFAGAGFDTVDGGGGSDLIFGDVGGILQSLMSSPSDMLADNMGTLSDSSDLQQLVKRLAIGSGGAADTITGGANNDLIIAGEGNDSVEGNGGNDYIRGGLGSDSIYGGTGDDRILGEGQGDLIYGDEDNDVLIGGTGGDTVYGGDGLDLIISTQGADFVGGGQDSDTYRVNLSGGSANSLIEIFDDGTLGIDVLEVNGTDRPDRILLRSDIGQANAFIAGLNGEFNVERINYDNSVERIIINGGAGDDLFAADDTAAEITINGESGDDRFQIGQLFREARNVNADVGGIYTGIDADDFFYTIEVTRGWLSNGISQPMTINGGIGNDMFTVFHNAAVLTLNGEAGDDIFEVRAFALKGSQEPLRERTDLTGGDGADLVRYAVNAPVNINGGDGFDTLIVIGTEFGDDFVITEDGVYGAGLNVNFVNIESLRVDGAEGDDRFFVQSTLETVLTELFGGLGDDTFNASGDTPPVVSNDFRGHSGIITHEIEASGDARYDGQSLFGISANVADNEIPFAIITESQGSTIVTEGDAAGDSYTIVLTSAPTQTVYVTVGAPLPSPGAREQGIRAFRVTSPDVVDPVTDIRADGSSLVLTFTTGNWDVAQTVEVIADGVANDYPGQLYTRRDIAGDSLIDPENFDFDDDAYEGQTNGVITHTFASGESEKVATLGYSQDVDPLSGIVTNAVITVDAPSFIAAGDLLGKRLTVAEGPGFGESRFIIGVTDNGATLDLLLHKGFTETSKPVAGESDVSLRVDDSIAGLVGAYTEDKAEEIFDDRTYFSGTKANGDPIDFSTYGSLAGFTVAIVGGAGAGQQLMILGVQDNEGTSELILNGLWTVDPDEDSIFRIQRYDGLQSQIVEVEINDNDAPGLIVDQTFAVDGSGAIIADDDTITAVIEGSDGDQTGERDVLKVQLSQALSGSDEVTLNIGYNIPDQIEVINRATGLAVTSLLFTSANEVYELEVRAIDDHSREGAHTAQIQFSFDTSDFPAAQTGSETLSLEYAEEDAVSSIGLTYKPDSITSLTVGGVAQVEGTDYVVIEGSNKILFIEQPLGSDDPLDPRKVFGLIEVEYGYSLDTYETYGDALVTTVLVRIADDDAPTVLVRETGGRTDLYEGGPTDTYEIKLTAMPVGEVEIELSEIITKTTKTGGIRYDNVQVEIVSINGVAVTPADRVAALDASGNEVYDEAGRLVTKLVWTFDETNWDEAVVIEVAAIDDLVVDGDDTQVFAPGPDTLAGILGPVIVDGAGGNGSLFGIGDPLMLPGEINIKEGTGQFGAGALDNDAAQPTLTVALSDLTPELYEDLRLGDTATPVDLIGKTLEITRAPAAPGAVDQFRLIINVVVDELTGLVTFYLNEAYDLSDIEAPNGDLLWQSFDPADANTQGNAGFPAEEDTPETDLDDPVNRYAITAESLNFFVDEATSVDVLFVHDGDSPADSTGTLTSSNLSGFNMGPDTLIGERYRQGGITFGQLEVLDITLGAGYNGLNIIGTPTREDGYEVRTIIRTGTEVPISPDLVDNPLIGAPVGDTVTVDLRAASETLASGTGYEAENPGISTGGRTEITLDLGFAPVDNGLRGQQLIIGSGDEQISRWVTGNEGSTLYLDNPLETLSTTTLAWTLIDPADGALSVDLQGGDDTLTASETTTRGMVVFGGEGNDTITTGDGEDIVFGDLGRVDYNKPFVVTVDGTEVTYSEIVTRLGLSDEAFLGLVEGQFTVRSNIDTNQNIFPVADTSTGELDDPYETGDTGLIGLYVDINDGTGFREAPRLIIDNDNGTLYIAPDLGSDLAADSGFRISTLPEDQGDGYSWGAALVRAIAAAMEGTFDDVIDTRGGDDTAMGGEGTDIIHTGTGDDIAFGDLGMVQNSFESDVPPEPVNPGDAVPTLRDGVFAIQIGTGAQDTVHGGLGSDLIVGGAGGDTLYGDTVGSTDASDGGDIIFGDEGFADYTDGVLGRLVSYDGSGGEDTIRGQGGADTVLGGGGTDWIYGDLTGASDAGAADLLIGDHGRILYDFDAVSPDSSTIDLIEGRSSSTDNGAADVIYGIGGADTILGGRGADYLYGDGRINHDDGTDGDDILIGDTGTLDYDTLDGEQSFLRAVMTTDTEDATGGADYITGDDGGDIILGGIGGDTLGGDNYAYSLLSDEDGADRIIGDNGEILFDADGVTINTMQSYRDGLGAADDIYGNLAGDWIIGGYGSDDITGNAVLDPSALEFMPALDGSDIILGDNGEILLSAGAFTRIATTDEVQDFDANDSISGAGAGDILLGGVGSDLIRGELAPLTDTADDGADIILGDNGELIFTDGDLREVRTLALAGSTEMGAADEIHGNTANDLIFGGTGGDEIHAGSNDDTVFGDHAEALLEDGVIYTLNVLNNGFGGNDTIFGDEHEDIVVGGFGSDDLDGDNVTGTDDPNRVNAGRDLIFGDNVNLDRSGTFYGDYKDPRYTTLDETGRLYGVNAVGGLDNGNDDSLLLVTGTPLLNPDGSAVWADYEIDMVNHNQEGADLGLFGDDYIAGGGAQDSIFGDLGDDIIQGDGGINYLGTDGVIRVSAGRDANGKLTTVGSFEATTDDDDYIEGNGGNDTVFGGLGQDDIVGDNSSFFSLDEQSERTGIMLGGLDVATGADMIFGGAGLRDGRAEYIEDGTGDVTVIDLEDRHSRDADMIMGDNGNIYRILVGAAYDVFDYDAADDVATEHYAAGSRGADRIVIRGADLLDYTEGGDAYGPASYGQGDEIHGESGDDSIYGMLGNDWIFGNSEDDDIIAGQGSDWVSGGTGQDGVLGGDGRIFTSRNWDSGTGDYSEEIYGIGFVDTNEFISTPGKIQQSTIHLEGYLKKTVDLTPFFPEDTGNPDDNITASIENEYDDNDIIFGGYGSDWLHGGFGSDAISGAEALNDTSDTPLDFSYQNPGNPSDPASLAGGVLNFGKGTDAEGNLRPNEFAAYNEFDPRSQVFYNPADNYNFTTDGSGDPFLLNFDAADGDAIESDGVATHSDGDDSIFGDLGNDWLVGGTGRDLLFGGFGSDLLNADDDHDAGGANDTPDTDDSYADIAYGGAGRDVLIGNTGGDRLIDWVGEFNSYIVPFAPFGAFTISRNVQPQIYDYLYDLSAAAGADPTRTADGTPDRNGEPYGEIGAVKQQDAFWQDQTGAPDDPQPGNIPGGARDVMAAESFNTLSTALIALAADSGEWTASGGKVNIAPEVKGADAVSVYHIPDYLPSYFEIVATMAADKDKAGYDSNGYLIFDYQSADDFKFAGINADTNKLEIGHRDASGWHVDSQSNMLLRADRFYHVLVSVNGTTVTALIDGKNTVTHTFDPRVENGIQLGLNYGLVGVGANNSRTTIDNLQVQVLPPELTYARSESFDADAGAFTGITVGSWDVTGGAYVATPGADGFAISGLDLSADAGLAPGALTLHSMSKVQITATVNTSSEAGIVFDMISSSRFKFVMLDAPGDRVLIGHYEGGGTWVTDAAVNIAAGIDAGTDYELTVLLSGTTVSVQLDGAFAGSAAFNAVTVDSAAGLIARDGAARFDDVLFETDDASVAVALEEAEALMASSTGTGGEALDAGDLDPLIDEAIRRLTLSLGLTEWEAARLEGLEFAIADLEGATLAEYDAGTVTLDIDGAGHGYFIDTTPEADEEFSAQGDAATGDADGKIDLLSVLMHEMGHALNLDHSGGGLMGAMLDPSTRLGLLAANDDAGPAPDAGGDELVFDPVSGTMVTPEEAELLALISEDDSAAPAAPVQGGKGRVRWAAE